MSSPPLRFIVNLDGNKVKCLLYPCKINKNTKLLFSINYQALNQLKLKI